MSKLILKATFTYRFEHEVDKEFKNSLEADEYFKRNKKYFEDRLMEELPVNPIRKNNITYFEMVGAYNDYSKYKNKLCRFWNKNQLPVIIDLLDTYYTNEEGDFVFETVSNNEKYDSFKPLTEEEIKILNL